MGGLKKSWFQKVFSRKRRKCHSKTKLMRSLLIILFLFFLSDGMYAQHICFQVDSVRIISLPRQLKTKLSLIDYDVLNFEPASLKKDTIIHNVIELNELINVLVKIDDYETLGSSIDTRMVICIFTDKDFVLKVSVDYLGNFKYLGDIYFREKEMLDWIRRNVSTWKDIR